MNLDRAEYFFVMLGVLFVTFNSFRHPGLYFTVSDLFFAIAIALRLTRSFPLAPLGAGSIFWMLGVVFLIGGLMLGSVVKGDPIRATVVIVQYCFAYVCLPLVVLARPYEQAVTLAKLGVWSVVLNCSAGLVAYAIGYNAGYGRHYMLVSGGGRLAGLVDNPNGLAGLIVFSLPLLWMLGITRAFRPVIAIVLCVTLLVSLVLTSSNTGIFGAAVCAVVFLVGLGSIRTIVYAGIGFGAVMFAMLTWGEQFLPETFQNRVLGAIESGDISEAGTFNDRVDLMVEAWGFLPDNMVIGLGADRYREISAHHLPVHNLYLLLANEGGVIALLGLVMIMLGALIAVMLTRGAPHKSLTLATIISLVFTYTSLAMTYAHMYQRSLVLPILLALGLAIPAVSPRRRQPAPTPA